MEIPLVQRDLLFVDVEATHLDPEIGEITEVAAVLVSHDLNVDKGVVHRKTRIERPGDADPGALKINGYDPRVWAREAVHVRAALVEVSALIGTDRDRAPVWVGANPIFDLTYLSVANRRENLKFPQPRFVLDVQNLAWPLLERGLVERLNLDTLCLRYGIPSRDAHTAMVDVRREMVLYRKLMGMQPRMVA